MIPELRRLYRRFVADGGDLRTLPSFYDPHRVEEALSWPVGGTDNPFTTCLAHPDDDVVAKDALPLACEGHSQPEPTYDTVVRLAKELRGKGGRAGLDGCLDGLGISIGDDLVQAVAYVVAQSPGAEVLITFSLLLGHDLPFEGKRAINDPNLPPFRDLDELGLPSEGQILYRNVLLVGATGQGLYAIVVKFEDDSHLDRPLFSAPVNLLRYCYRGRRA